MFVQSLLLLSQRVIELSCRSSSGVIASVEAILKSGGALLES